MNQNMLFVYYRKVCLSELGGIICSVTSRSSIVRFNLNEGEISDLHITIESSNLERQLQRK